MSNTNNNMQTQTSNSLHNAIMKASGKDRPPMLVPDNYVQWKSRIKRYIDTKPNHELIHYCLKNPPYKFTWADKTVLVSEGSPKTTIKTYIENYKNVSQDIHDQLNAEAEDVQIILTGIDNDIYSTVDACPNAYAADFGPIFDDKPMQNVSNNDNYNVFAMESEHPEEQIDQDDEDNDLANEHSLKFQLETQKTQFLNEIDRLSREHYYVDHMNTILGVYTELDEVTNLQCDYLEMLDKCECLKKELSKSKMMSKNFEALQKHAINLELDLQQCKEKLKNDESFKENKSKEFCKEREQYFEIQDLKAQLQNKGIAISELKKLIKKLKGKSVDTKFDKSSVIQQPNAFKSQRPSILGVIPTTSVGRPQLKSNPMKDRVMLNNSQGKKQDAEDQRRNVKFSKNKTSVTACNDSLNAQTSDVNFVCATCGKCVLNEKHDMCVLKSRNGVKSRTKMPMAVPLVEIIIFIFDSGCSKHMTGNLKLLINFVEKFLGTVKFGNDQIAPILGYGDLVQGSVTIKLASESNQKPRNSTRKLYERISKACSWWYLKFTPSEYNRKPKSKIENVKPNLVEIVLFIVDSGCSKHMTGNLKLLINFVEKFLGTVKFGNDQIAPILAYGDLVQGAITIKRVYYVEGLNHNLFSVGQFCDADLEVAFRKSTCYIRDLKENDLLTGSRGTDLYSITLQDTTSPNPICLMAKATSSQAWLWHRHRICSSYELGKAKRKSFQMKATPSSKRRLQLLHMDLRGPMRVASINWKKYVLAHVRTVRTDKGTEFLNKNLHAYFASEGINHQTSVARTPEQNGVIKRRNRTLVEAARTMLSIAKVPLNGENLDKMKEKGASAVVTTEDFGTT
nr:hypothetical protein [Tanacetum cinerariifolium]